MGMHVRHVKLPCEMIQSAAHLVIVVSIGPSSLLLITEILHTLINNAIFRLKMLKHENDFILEE